MFNVKLEAFDAAAKPKIIREVKAMVPNLTLIEVRPRPSAALAHLLLTTIPLPSLPPRPIPIMLFFHRSLSILFAAAPGKEVRGVATAGSQGGLVER